VRGKNDGELRHEESVPCYPFRHALHFYRSRKPRRPPCLRLGRTIGCIG
jgi:hypothetical protein